MTKNQEFAASRRALRVSQGRVARRAGVSQTFVSQFEIGNRSLRPEQIKDLENALQQELAEVANEAVQVAKQYGPLLA